jgi:hypothetical protein
MGTDTCALESTTRPPADPNSALPVALFVVEGASVLDVGAVRAGAHHE